MGSSEVLGLPAVPRAIVFCHVLQVSPKCNALFYFYSVCLTCILNCSIYLHSINLLVKRTKCFLIPFFLH